MDFFCAECGVRLAEDRRRHCAYCFQPLAPQWGPGRAQRYCTRSCRDKAYYQRTHGETWDNPGRQLRQDLDFWRRQWAEVSEELEAARADIARLQALLGQGEA
jgi:hypothetical protein